MKESPLMFTGSKEMRAGLELVSSHENRARRCPVSMSETTNPGECSALPVWISALIAIDCKASGIDYSRSIEWQYVGGRALYTNSGSDARRIEPLGVHLESGYTVSVGWVPNQTAYSVDVFRQRERCA